MKGRGQQSSGPRQSDLIKSLFRFLPFEGWAVREVAFEGRDVDTKVPHPFNTTEVFYIPIRIKGASATIYDQHQLVADGEQVTPWTNDYIVVRSTTDNVIVTLLVFTLRREGTRDR